MTPNFSRHPTAAFSGRATQETQDAKPSNAAITSIRCVGAVLITIPVSSLFHSSLMEAMLVGIVVGIFAVLWGVKFNPFTETESPLIHFRAETVGAALAEGIAAGIVVPVVYAVVMGVIAGFRTR